MIKPKTVDPITRLAAATTIAVLVAGCEASKSENPLSPTVAGPIAGVSIDAPQPVSPVNGAEVVNNEPLRLVFNNGHSNGQRPLHYIVELGSDAQFSSKQYANSKVPPGEGGRTTVVVDGSLAAERTYYWRVRADDGANASEFSSAARFDLVIPVILQAPEPISPAGGQTTANNTPQLVVNNGRVQGRVGTVEYRYFVSRNTGFTDIVAETPTTRSDGATTTVLPPGLPYSTVLYWRVVASNGTIRDLSGIQHFRTPAAPGGGGGGGGGGYVPPPAPAPGGRTPDPPPGGKLPLPNMSGVVSQVAAQYPNALRNSCQDTGGTWEFMDRVVDELRKYDSRWGYNWKRGNVGDPSKDVVDYHWGRGGDEGSSEVYIIDVIGGHCGGSPSPVWNDVTDITYGSGTIGRWTGRGRF